jgi:hypothetical protein
MTHQRQKQRDEQQQKKLSLLKFGISHMAKIHQNTVQI